MRPDVDAFSCRFFPPGLRGRATEPLLFSFDRFERAQDRWWCLSRRSRLCKFVFRCLLTRLREEGKRRKDKSREADESRGCEGDGWPANLAWLPEAGSCVVEHVHL